MKTELIGINPIIERIKELIKQVVDTGLMIVVDGETGVDKGLSFNICIKNQTES